MLRSIGKENEESAESVKIFKSISPTKASMWRKHRSRSIDAAE